MSSEAEAKIIDIDDEDQQELADEYESGGYLLVRIGDRLHRKYRVIRKLGWGAFSTVWLCWDAKRRDYVAVKIAKSKRQLREAAYEEIDVLEAIRRQTQRAQRFEDPFAQRVVTFLNQFEISGIRGRHVCMVFEVLGQSLWHFLISHYRNGLPIELLKPIAVQILEGLVFLHTKCRLIHTDIKPENILLTIDRQSIQRMHTQVSEWLKTYTESQLPNSYVSTAIKTQNADRSRRRTQNSLFGDRISLKSCTSGDAFNANNISVKIADLGNALEADQYNQSTIQTRPYRSPEVILGTGYSTSADIWSLACTIFELATGECLFDHQWPTEAAMAATTMTKNEAQLARIIERLGPLPVSCQRGRHYRRYFTRTHRLFAAKEIKEKSIEKVLIDDHKWIQSSAQSFSQFLLPMLRIDPRRRATADQCLSDPWLK